MFVYERSELRKVARQCVTHCEACWRKWGHMMGKIAAMHNLNSGKSCVNVINLEIWRDSKDLEAGSHVWQSKMVQTAL